MLMAALAQHCAQLMTELQTAPAAARDVAADRFETRSDGSASSPCAPADAQLMRYTTVFVEENEKAMNDPQLTFCASRRF